MTESIDDLERTRQHMQSVFTEADLLFNGEQIERAIDTIADDIERRLASTSPILMCVMNGGLVLSGKLATRLSFPLEMDYLHASRYRGATQGGELVWKQRPQLDLVNRTVLVIDDILDEGHTLHAILQYCRDQGAASTFSAVLVDKQHNRKAIPDLKADFCGLSVADRYVFGYGMDYHGYWRNAPGIYAVKGL